MKKEIRYAVKYHSVSKSETYSNENGYATKAEALAAAEKTAGFTMNENQIEYMTKSVEVAENTVFSVWANKSVTLTDLEMETYNELMFGLRKEGRSYIFTSEINGNEKAKRGAIASMIKKAIMMVAKDGLVSFGTKEAKELIADL